MAIILNMNKATLEDVNNLVGRRVFIRADFNVPMDEEGIITDDNRIRAGLETINYCLKRGAKVILASHLGRPEGCEKKYSLEPVAVRLRKLLPKTVVYFCEDCIGYNADAQATALRNGEVLLLENTRFHKEEEANDDKFAQQLASLADIFVLDAFASAHRAHASTVGLTKYLPSVAGFLMQREIQGLSLITESPKRPLTIIVGGKKIADKLGVIKNLVGKADNLLIGGELIYQVDKYCPEYKKYLNLSPDRIDEHDIGPKTIAAWTPIINKSATVFWNGPMGVFEDKKYGWGTKTLAEIIEKSGTISVIGGGDTVSAVKMLCPKSKFTYLSTGGSASLEFIGGETLPGIAALPTVAEFNKIEAKRGITI
jgi:phosphoglycerate kinase